MYWLLVAIAAYTVAADISGHVVLNTTMNQTLTLDIMPSNAADGGSVNILFTGNTQGWFGVGFNNTDMKATYAIVVDYSGIIYEYYLGSGTCSPGCDTQLKPTYSVLSNTIDGDVRKVNISRPLNDNSNGAMYFNFPTAATNLQLIWAYGIKSQLFQQGTGMGYHGETMIKLS